MVGWSSTCASASGLVKKTKLYRPQLREEPKRRTVACTLRQQCCVPTLVIQRYIIWAIF